jgi:hypothetical protein
MSTLLLDTTFLSADDFDFQAHGRGNEMCDRTQADHSTKKLAAIFSDDRQAVSAFRTNSLGTFIHELFMCCTLQRVEPFGCCGAILRQPLKGRTTMVTKISTAVVVALVAFLAAPTASFAASKTKTKDSFRDVTKCEGGGCTAVNPDRDPNTSLHSQYYRSTHKKHKTQPKS